MSERVGQPPLAPQEVIDRIVCMHQAGVFPQDMPPPATALLAEVGYFTTVAPRHPVEKTGFKGYLAAHRMLGRLAANTSQALAGKQGYEDSATHGTQLSNAFRAAYKLRADGVHNSAPEQDMHGKATAECMTYFMGDERDAKLLHTAFWSFLPHNSPVAAYRDTERGEPVVHVHGMNEFMVRVIGSAVSELLAQQDLKRTGMRLPVLKMTLPEWQKEGETFPPEKLAWLQAIDREYGALQLEATYKGRPYMEYEKWPHSLGTDPAASFQGARDLFGPLIIAMRGDGTHNREQDPNRSARLPIEAGVELLRHPVCAQKAVRGPGLPRVLTIVERLALSTLQTADYTKRHLPTTILKVTAKALTGGGLDDVAVTVLLAAPHAVRALTQSRRDTQAWHQEIAKAYQARGAVGQAIAALRAKYGE